MTSLGLKSLWARKVRALLTIFAVFLGVAFVAGSLAWGATRVEILRTGRRVKLVKTDGTSRQLDRNIVRTTLHNIPIKVVSA